MKYIISKVLHVIRTMALKYRCGISSLRTGGTQAISCITEKSPSIGVRILLKLNCQKLKKLMFMQIAIT